jgi:sugar phosphate permease
MKLLSTFGAFVAFACSMILLPLYLQNVLGYDSERAGFSLVAMMLMFGLSSGISGPLSNRLGGQWFEVGGLSILALGEVLLATLTVQSTMFEVITRSIVVGVGLGLFLSPNMSLVMGATPKSMLGVTSGVLATIRNLGVSSGFALGGASWALWVIALVHHPHEPIVAAPVAVLMTAMHRSMLLAAALAMLAIIPACLGRQQIPADTGKREAVCTFPVNME